MDKNDVIKMFSERKEIYGEMTTMLFGEFERCLNIIESAFGGILTNFIWLDIEYDELDNVVLFYSIAEYQNNTLTIQNDKGETKDISVLDEHGKLQKREINIGIPIELALGDSDEELYGFFMQTHTNGSGDVIYVENSNGDAVSYVLLEPFEAQEENFTMETQQKRVLH